MEKSNSITEPYMSPGDKVKHKLSGQTMTIVRVSETVATCKVPKYETKSLVRGWPDRHVCLVENLIPVARKSQLKLF